MIDQWKMAVRERDSTSLRSERKADLDEPLVCWDAGVVWGIN